MRITSADGTALLLAIEAYQFPDQMPVAAGDWDANWLQIRGAVVMPDGRRHDFLEPCLTTGEAAELSWWLRSPDVDGPDGGPSLTFTEPNLAFGATNRAGGDLEVRVYLSLEAEPPVVVAGRAGMFSNCVPILTDAASLAAAADAWDVERGRFPTRAPDVAAEAPASGTPCPCGRPDIHSCCGPYLDATALPPTAEATMRSRYSAFATGNTDHLFRTWHPRTRPPEVSAPSPDAWLWLDVLDVQSGRPGDSGGVIEFIAHHVGGEVHERSRFEFRGGRWLYLDGEG